MLFSCCLASDQNVMLGIPFPADRQLNTQHLATVIGQQYITHNLQWCLDVDCYRLGVTHVLTGLVHSPQAICSCVCRHGQAFQGLAHSLSPFLAYYAAPALQQLEGQISAVAKANAASVAHTRAMGEADTQRQAPQTAPHQLASSTAAPSPFSFSAAPFPADSPRSSREGRISSPGSAQGISHEAAQPTNRPQAGHTSTQGPQSSVQQQGPPPAAPNPFAQAAATIPADEPFDTASSGHRPVSPFAAAAQFSGRLFSSQKKKPSRADSPSASRPDAHLQKTEGQIGQKPDAGAWPEAVSADSGTASSGGIAGSAWERRGSESSVEDTTAAPAEAEAQGDSNQLDAGFVFKRKPVSSAFARRYSTTTFHGGVLHTPSQHFPQFSTMESLVEAASGEAEQSGSPSKEVIVDDHTYMSQFNRRALSTPDFDHDIAGSAPTLLQQMRTRSTCADSVLQSTASEPSSTTGAQDTQADLKHLHTSHAKEDVHRTHTQSRFSSPTSPSRAALQRKQTSPQAFATESASAESASDQHAEAQSAFTDALKHEHDFKGGPAFPEGKGKSSAPGHMQSEVAEPAAAGSGAATFPVPTVKETLATASQMQHQVWLTFTDPQLEAKYVAWFGRKVGKVRHCSCHCTSVLMELVLAEAVVATCHQFCCNA